MDLEPYEDTVADAELIPAVPQPGEIVSEAFNESLGVTTWILSNGARVLVKPTDFKMDEVMMSAWSPGGFTRIEDGDWPKVRKTQDILSLTGMGDFSVTDLDKLLSGKNVGLQATLGKDRHGLSGLASPKDLETLFQLMHLRCTTVRKDEEAFASYRNLLRASLQNRRSDPKAVFDDLIQTTMSNHHPRNIPMDVADVEKLDLDASLEFFADSFSDAGQMTFFFVGNVELETLRPLVRQWIASLPGAPAETERHFEAREYPAFEVERTLRMGLEPISEVHMVWTSDEFEWSYGSRHAIQSMVGALRIRLREELREEQGGTYHVSIGARLRHYPTPRKQLLIRFGCDPERVDELIQEVNRLVQEVSSTPLEQRYIDTVKETQLRQRETDLRENSFWNYVIPYYDWHREDPGILLEFGSYVESITPESIRKTAEEMFSTPHRAVFRLLPGEHAND
jgi:zinc protease